ncbi:MAG: class I SAM-dependent methyltransferase [Proteobacteria bacterium]|nr:class I SAM-dependent methyltransferase [Pseudomonadota bacterium]
MSAPARFDVVPELHLLPAHARCPLCGSDRPRTEVALLQEDPRVAMSACPDCRGMSADRFPDDAFLRALYDPAHYASDLLQNARPTERCARHVASFVEAAADCDLRILDYGGSDGSLSQALAEALRRRGYRGRLEFTIVDFAPAKSHDEFHFIDVDAFYGLEDPFDVVLASAVLEHLTEFPRTVQKLLSLAGPGALFYARTPYEVPLQRRFPGYRVRWPRHVHDLGPAFWDRFLATFGVAGRLRRSAPSIVESDWRQKPVRTAIATALKAPGHLETAWLKPALGYSGNAWHWVGGWEVVLQLGVSDG